MQNEGKSNGVWVLDDHRKVRLQALGKITPRVVGSILHYAGADCQIKISQKEQQFNIRWPALILTEVMKKKGYR
jgi:hypothetical protein